MPGVAPSPLTYSSIVDEVTYQQYMRGEWELTKKMRILTEMLEKNGNIKFDEAGGKYIEWKARVGEYIANYRADLDARQFARKQQRVSFTAPWGFMDMTGTLSDRDLQLNRGPSAIKTITQSMLTDMGYDFKKRINKELLQQNGGSQTTLGLAAFSGATTCIYGLPTVFGVGSGTVQNYIPQSQTTTGNIAATDKEALPNGTYCGVSTNPTTSIAGVDNQLAESTSPVITNWSSTAWTAGTATFIDNCLDVASHLNLRLFRSADPDECADLGILNKTMYETFKQALRKKTTQMVILEDSPKEPDVGLVKRKFLPFEGVNIFIDDDCPSNVFYWLNTKKMEFRLLPQDPAQTPSEGAIKGDATEMFTVTQQHSIEQGGWLVAATFAGQLMLNPRYQGVAYNLA